jgi:predicted O-linked N-acetylglucosamine transferase (SPINDLY family)
MQNSDPLSPAAPLSLLQATEQDFAQASQGLLSITDLFSAGQRLIDANHSDIMIQLYRLWLERSASPIAYAVQFNLAITLSNSNDNVGAEAAYRAAIAQNPTFAEAHLNLGTLLEQSNRSDEALSIWRAVLTLVNPKVPAESVFYVQALNNLGRLLEILKELPEAESMLSHSLKQDSKQLDVITHWVHLRQKLCKWPVYCKTIGASTKNMLAGTSALAMLSVLDDPALQLKTASRYVDKKVLKDVPYLSERQSYGHERLRIGYLSSDFCSHAVSILTAELYSLHDRSKFEVFGFCWSHEDGSPLRARVVSGMDYHIKIGSYSDEEAARLIRSCEIDILVDLQGLTLGTRHDILSYRPAPVQITWLGFPGSTGLPEIDYVLSDAFVLPPELEPFFTEKPLHMPHTFQINDRQRIIGPCPTKESCGLPEDAFVFCSFNNNYKLTSEVFATWMRILKRAPGSILWLVADNEVVRKNLCKHAKKQGVAPERLYFADRVAPADYLARFQVADLFLDTFPFGAGTTASDALWAGLPLLTYAGRTFASRMAGSLLKAVDLPGLITYNPQDYENQAVALAEHPKRVAAMKQQLIDNRLSCVLFDSPRFVSEFETLCRKVIDELPVGISGDKGDQVVESVAGYPNKSQNSKKLRFLIAAPRYDHQSGGVMALHKLCDMLNRQGHEAAMVLFGGGAPCFNWSCTNDSQFFHPDYQRVHLSMTDPDKSVRDFLENGVIIYPDLITDNPLGASRVVRYILCHNESYAAASASEYVLSFSKMFHSNSDGYLFQALSDDNFHSIGAPHWSKRSMDLTYFGKGPNFIDCFRIPETLIVTRTWPEDKEQLAILLRQCRYFFTWDSVTQTNIDAIACGAVPIFLHDRQTTQEELSRGELGAYPNISLPDLHDKKSVVGDEAEIDQQIIEMNDKYLWQINSWPERVNEFAIDVNLFFQDK